VLRKGDTCERIVVVRAPGRVNLLGGHTDYNQGYVLPVATAQGTYVAGSPRQDGCFRVRSAALDAVEEFHLDDCDPSSGDGWTGYLRGVLWALREVGVGSTGFDAAIVGDLPIGAGVASSAALEVSVALLICEFNGARIPREELALLCQRAENEFVGVRCGILDQFSSVFGQAGSALLIDCRSLDVSTIPMGRKDAAIIVCDTAKPRGLIESEYNARRRQCEQAALSLGLETLRDGDLSDLEGSRTRLGDEPYRRARHVISENGRVLRGAEALRHGDFAQVGQLLLEAHASLRDDYGVSCPELDTMVEIAAATHGCFGARLVGAGFGGCTVALVAASEADAFCRSVEREYKARVGRDGRTFVTWPSQGAGLVQR